MKNTKIVIDKRKLDTLVRLGCPDSALIETIKTGKTKKTGDALIDDYLQTFFVVKTFSDKWGGNHNPTGKNQIKSKDCLGQLDRQDEGQDVDIDKDIDNIFSLDNKRGVGEKENLSLKESSSLQDEIEKSFEIFWAVYPKQRAGNKQKALLAYKKAIKENRSTPDKINLAAGVYAKSEQVLKGFAKGAAAWLNDDRFNNEEYQKRDYSIPISLLKAKPVIISEEEKLKDQQDFNDLIGRIKEFSDEV